MSTIMVGCGLFIKLRIALWFIGIRSVSAVTSLSMGAIGRGNHTQGRSVPCEETMRKSVEITVSVILTVLMVFVLWWILLR